MSNKHMAAYNQAQILAALADGPLTVKKIAPLTKISKDTVGRTITRMLQTNPKRVHVSEWQYVAGSGWSPRYKAGDGECMSLPDFRATHGPVENSTVNTILAMLEAHGPLSSDEIAAELGCGRENVGKNLKRVSESPRKVRIADYRLAANGSQLAPLYDIGSEPDAEKPSYARMAELRGQRDIEKRPAVKVRRFEQQTWVSSLGI